MDEAVSQMVTITDTTPERAQQYLQVTDGDIEQAVSLFFESGGADLGPVPNSTQSNTRVTGSGIEQDPINIEDDLSTNTVPGTASQPRIPEVEDDEAMARRLQEEMYGGAGDSTGGDPEQPIRAPIARQTEVLAGPGASDYYGGSTLDDAIQERMQAFQTRRGKVESYTECVHSANRYRRSSCPGYIQPTANL